jgi:anaerobic ribonucleoside-triphosphate reductase activating protein
LQIERIFYPLETLGYGKRIGIWTIGCPHACFNCSNPELWKENKYKDLPMSYIFQMLSAVKGKVDVVTISGGEPFQQIKELRELVHYIYSNISDDILLYSGYTLDELKRMDNPDVDDILGHVAAFVDGKYEDEKNDNSPLKGSSNQVVHILNEKYRSRYENLLKGSRQVQTVFVQNDVLAFGIPLKDTKAALREQLPNYGLKMGKS